MISVYSYSTAGAKWNFQYKLYAFSTLDCLHQILLCTENEAATVRNWHDCPPNALRFL
jgi:hypothetical protein